MLIFQNIEVRVYMYYYFRLFEEIKDFFKFELDIPSADSVLIRDVDKWLRMAGAVSKVVIVFDALNQLDDGTGEGTCVYDGRSIQHIDNA